MVRHFFTKVAQARRALVLAEERYARGLDNYLLILDTQRRLYQTEAELIETERIVRTTRALTCGKAASRPPVDTPAMIDTIR